MFYYEAAENVAPRVGSGEFEKGILICGTGMGMSMWQINIKACTLQFVRIHTAAEKSRAINNANILTMGGWITGRGCGCQIADTFDTEFTQNLEEWRANNLRNAEKKVKEIEEQIYG